MLTLYLVRHGQTAWSREYRFCGSGSDVPLAPEGEQMAEALADFYADTPWEAIYASSLRRARDTAMPLSHRTGLAVRIEDGLREIAYGAWEGKIDAEIRAESAAALERWLADPGRFAPPGGETATAIAARAMAVVEAIRSRHPSGNVLAVSHKGTIRILVCALLGLDPSLFRARMGLPASAVTIVEFRPEGPLLRAMGDTSHVPAHLRHDLGV